MKVIIIEDETRAASHLARLLDQVEPGTTIIARPESIRDAVPLLQSNVNIDLIFSDVQLADGLSFEIFKQVPVKCPIIFTTAYDQYAIEAFKTNGIDYLLKPIEEGRLKQALDKVKQFMPVLNVEKIITLAHISEHQSFKSRFLVKVGDKIKSVPTEEILACYSLEKATFLFTNSNRNYCIDYTLDQLDELLDPKCFFRINRKYIVSIHACSNILAWSNSRFRLKIDGLAQEDIIVARERVHDFKEWLDR